MDWLLTNPQIISTFSSLGFLKDDVYEISPDAFAILEEINLKLIYEDQTLRTFRRAIGFGQHVKTDLIPLLINAKDPEIIDAVIRILVNLTVPVECLFCVDIMYRTEVGRSTIFELNKLLITSKEAFSDAKSTKSILDRIKTILDGESKKLSIAQCDSINNCLLLLRNILHIPENSLMGPHSGSMNNTTGTNGTSTSLQNTILWNLFIQSIDKTILFLMSCPQRAHWVVTMVQLIALMYKDQHVGTLQKLLNMWFEASLSESSEDNESNTTPPNKGSGDSSPMLTSSDPTSDSSDNGGSGGGGGNKEKSEDHRQTNLNKETEATLQEVSRKGHEYQNAMMRIPTTIKKESKISQDQQNHESKNQGNLTKKSYEQQQRYSLASNNNNNNNDTSTPQKQKQPNIPADPKNTSDNNMFVSPPAKSKIDIVKNNSICSTNQAIKSPHSGILCNGKCPAQKRECPSSTSELSDCGYGTQVENQESISTSSNEDESPQQKPVHQKPHINQKPRPKQHSNVSQMEKKEWRRKKLVKRSKSNLINMKGLIQHTPTDEDISNILKEFTVDFLLKGYGYLVQELHAQLLEDLKFPMDTSHFFWLVTYFLKFASQLELDLEHINSVLNYEVISYLTFEGTMLCEQLELTSRQEGGDMKPFLRRIHLVVTAIREFLQALDTYKKITHLTQDDRQYLRNLQLQVCGTDDLRSLLLLLIRKFNPMWNSRQYLQDLIVTNHDLLILLDNVTKSEDKNLIDFNMTEHIPQFAQVEIMHHYALLLDDFRDNGEFVNDCIFTMMHHIGADLEQVQLLFQPLVLKTFSQIWESEFEVCDDWSDLIEYVIHKFMKSPRNNNFVASCGSLTEMTKEHNMEHNNCIWGQDEKDILYWHYVQSKKTKDIVGKIRQLYKENGNSEKSRISIIQQLLQQDVVTLVEYDDLMRLEDSEYEKNVMKKELSSNTSESGIDVKDSMAIASNTSKDQSMDNIQYLRRLLIKEGKSRILQWLQRVLLECCYVKLSIDYGKLDPPFSNNEEETAKIRIMESIPYHCILRKKSIPLVPWNTDQSAVMTHKPFVMLLHKLGFHLPADAGSIYARVPEFWTADILYNIAQKLGTIDKNMIKFDINLLHNIDQQPDEMNIKEEIKLTDMDKINQLFSVPSIKHSNSIIRFTPEPTQTPSVPNWLQLVMKSKCNVNMGNNNSSSQNNINNDNINLNNNNNNNNINYNHNNSITNDNNSINNINNNYNDNNNKNNNCNNNNIPSLKTLEAIADIENHQDTILEEEEEEDEEEGIEELEEIEEENEEDVDVIEEDINEDLYENDENLLITENSNTTSMTETANALNIAVSKAFSQYKTETTSFMIPIKKSRNSMLQQQSSEDDSLMKSLEENRDDSSGYQTRRGSQMDTEFNTIVTSVIDTEFLNNVSRTETDSISSDLTRMYVSDEEHIPCQ